MDDTDRMMEHDCIKDLVLIPSDANEHKYEIPKRGTQTHAPDTVRFEAVRVSKGDI